MRNYELKSFKDSIEDLGDVLEVGEDLARVFLKAGFKDNTKYDYKIHYRKGQEYGLVDGGPKRTFTKNKVKVYFDRGHMYAIIYKGNRNKKNLIGILESLSNDTFNSKIKVMDVFYLSKICEFI